MSERSPLLFILAFDTLSSLFQEAMNRRSIVGVEFPKSLVHALHSMFADDFYVVIRANIVYIREFQRILDVFGRASGLVCAWDKTIASAIPAGPPPMALWLFPWKWENDTHASPLLGAPVAQTIVVQQLEEMLIQKLETRLIRLRPRKLSLAARILVANTLLLGCIWYFIVFWAGERPFLRKLQRIIDHYVWAGRSRVRRSTVALPRAEGGLGLLGVEEQFIALTSGFMVWILEEGEHPLRSILRSHLHQVSARRWGNEDLTWIVAQCGTMRMEGSAPWRNICKAWADLKGKLVPLRPANFEEWTDLPLWTPHLNHVDCSIVSCKSAAQKALRNCGFRRMVDILDAPDSAITWEEAVRRGAPVRCEVAFRNLIQNIILNPVVDAPNALHDFYVQGTDGPDRDMVWQFRLPSQHLSERWLPFMDTGQPEATFKSLGRVLIPVQVRRPV